MDVDARNQACPRPVVLTLSALSRLAPGETLNVLVNDEVATNNLRRLAEEKNCGLAVSVNAGETTVSLTPRERLEASGSAEQEASAYCDVPAASQNPSAVLVGSATLGKGDDVLGAKLMSGLIYALAHGEVVPKTVIFYNGGAPFCCEGSESLEDIRELAARGCEVLTCGTCLDFLGIRDKLAVGGVTNLYHIGEVISSTPGVTSI